MQTKQMIGAHPEARGPISPAAIQCIDAAYACAQACTSCADASLAESGVHALRQCIRLSLDCGDVCLAMASLASRHTGANEAVMRKMLDVCMTACRLCEDECRRHAGREYCRICADSCQQCCIACQNTLETLRSSV